MKRSKEDYQNLVAVVVELFAKGLTAREAAIEARCSKGDVAGIWQRRGLLKTKPRLSREEMAQRKREYDFKRRGNSKLDEYERRIERITQHRPPPAVAARFVNPNDRRAGK